MHINNNNNNNNTHTYLYYKPTNILCNIFFPSNRCNN